MNRFVEAQMRFLRADRNWKGGMNAGQTEFLNAAHELDRALQMLD